MAENSPSSALVVEAAAAFVAPELAAEVRAALERALGEATPAEQQELAERLMTTGRGWGYFPPNPLAKAINCELGHITVQADSKLRGASALAEAPGPLVYLANHLSFSDANLFAYLLERDGFRTLASRLCVLAGPKVFTDPFRRFSSLCFGSIKLPQSPSRASGEAVMPRREVARLAAETIAASAARLQAGDHLMIFVEGARSRTAAMQPALGAVSRYLELPGTRVVPVGITGSEHLVPIGEEHAHRTHVDIQLGAPVEAAALVAAARGNRSTLMHAVGLLIARQLPNAYRGFYADDAAAELEPAAEALASL